MRTPWKVLYDWTTPIVAADLGPVMYRLQGPIWVACFVAPIAILLWLLSLLANWLAPQSGLALFLSSHFWSAVVTLGVLFFFYWFFRSVWDGLKEPTVGVVNNESKDG